MMKNQGKSERSLLSGHPFNISLLVPAAFTDKFRTMNVLFLHLHKNALNKISDSSNKRIHM